MGLMVINEIDLSPTHCEVYSTYALNGEVYWILNNGLTILDMFFTSYFSQSLVSI